MVFVIVLTSSVLQHWSKLITKKGGAYPRARMSHACVCLGYGGDCPQLLVTGGWDNTNSLSDMWTLDIQTVQFRKVC